MNFIRNCVKCGTQKRPGRAPNSPMTEYTVSFHLISAVARKQIKLYLSFCLGCCLDLHSDRATIYQSELFREVCRLLENKHIRASGFRQVGNGMLERFNSTLLNKILAYADENQRNWDRYFPLLTLVFNSTVNSSSGYTPYKLMFSRDFTNWLFTR